MEMLLELSKIESYRVEKEFRVRRVDVERLLKQLEDGIGGAGFRYEPDLNLLRILKPNFNVNQLPGIYE